MSAITIGPLYVLHSSDPTETYIELHLSTAETDRLVTHFDSLTYSLKVAMI